MENIEYVSIGFVKKGYKNKSILLTKEEELIEIETKVE